MKKILFGLLVSVAVIGCSKEEICMECKKQGEQDLTVCNDETNNISVIAYVLTNDGYTCERLDN